jgi:hypothetical protein
MESYRSGMTGVYSFLPYAGGLLEQPDWLMDDLRKISMRYHILEEELFNQKPVESGVAHDLN